MSDSEASSGSQAAYEVDSRSPSPAVAADHDDDASSSSDNDDGDRPETTAAKAGKTTTKTKVDLTNGTTGTLTVEPTTSVTFSSLGLLPELCSACTTLGFKHPSEIQQECIPYALEGKDIIGLAQTGSGKTAAFALPILHHLWQDPQGLFAVVLAPTRCVLSPCLVAPHPLLD